MSSATEANPRLSAAVLVSKPLFTFFPMLPEEIRMMIWTHHHLSDSKVLELGMIPTMKNEHWSGSFTISSSHDTLTPVCAESERFVIKNSEEITGFKDRDCELRDTSIRYGPDHDIVFLGRNIVTYEDEKISDYNARVILNSTRILKGMCASSMRDSLKSITVDIKTWLHCHFLDKLTMFPHLECINLALVGRIRNGSRGEKRCSAAGGGLVFRDRYGLVDSPIAERMRRSLLKFWSVPYKAMTLSEHFRKYPCSRWTSMPELQFKVLVEGEGKLRPIEEWIESDDLATDWSAV